MQIFMETLTGKTITLEVEGRDPINNVKAKIQDNEVRERAKMEIAMETLTRKTITLEVESSDTIVKAKIQDKEVRERKRSKKAAKMKIFVKNFHGRFFPLEVDISDTINNVKAKIQRVEGTSTELLGLNFNGKLLRDDCTLADYNIQKDSTLPLMLVRRYKGAETNKISSTQAFEQSCRGFFWLESCLKIAVPWLTMASRKALPFFWCCIWDDEAKVQESREFLKHRLSWHSIEEDEPVGFH